MSTLLVGIAPEHAPALVAGIVALVSVAMLRTGSRSPVNRWAAALLAYAAAVHLFLPVGHRTGTRLALLFFADGAAFGVLAWRAHHGRTWRLGTAILAPLTVVAYAVAGGEPDQVGILTVLLELTVFGLAVATTPGVRRVLGAIATVLLVVVFGAVLWVESFVAHKAASTQADAPSVGHSHAGGHEHVARAQAGVIMRPIEGSRLPTVQQVRAANALAAATKAAVKKYQRLEAALTAGYQLPLVSRTGMDVHLENKKFTRDGHILDPERPEMLVYAIDGGKATLLGVVFQLERAGEPGPAPGGPLTSWHAHNLCVSLIPPGIGIVSPYGGCPSFSVSVTTPEMMHVWIVDPPGGAFAEGVDEAWASEYHRTHGLPT